ncbi:ribonuclease HII [Calothrix sp. UHCC 0171]|uniref:ribonuclease HII n=1 Tax=Calothrix sp. UHCC 0171 TaxID=3110245 RepID=UPI002B202A02|nr:ribonuclease HII [Calothrix sp. UHCC 0171]MEA5570226.1 ribonuclease HII [Calothrix sp. UHCC 0171]
MVKQRQTTDIELPLLPTTSNWLELSTLSNQPGLIAGVDEVGRGALFGPVVAAAVILPQSAFSELITAGINDSKKLSPLRRSILAHQIGAIACDWRIGFASVAEIDQINILQASLLAMKRAVLKLSVQPTLCLIDGNYRVNGLLMSQQTIIKGDSLSLAIAAASIIAKVWRDDLICRLAINYPQYDLARNKGYGSQRHLAAIQEYGVTRLHRKSFSPCQKN